MNPDIKAIRIIALASSFWDMPQLPTTNHGAMPPKRKRRKLKGYQKGRKK